MLRTILTVSACMFPLAALAAPWDWGPEWVEEGDAGSLPNEAQDTTGQRPLRGIQGTLGVGLWGTDEEDMYIINVVDPSVFRVSTSREFGGQADFDTHLWLFRLVEGVGEGRFGIGLLSNDDMPGDNFGASTITQFSNDGSEAFVDEPGLYLLAITQAGNEAFSDAGPIYFFKNRFEISGPDGKGGGLPITGWSGGGGGGDVLSYRIDLVLPGPGGIMLLALGGVLPVVRRRRM